MLSSGWRAAEESSPTRECSARRSGGLGEVEECLAYCDSVFAILTSLLWPRDSMLLALLAGPVCIGAWLLRPRGVACWSRGRVVRHTAGGCNLCVHWRQSDAPRRSMLLVSYKWQWMVVVPSSLSLRVSAEFVMVAGWSQEMWRCGGVVVWRCEQSDDGPAKPYQVRVQLHIHYVTAWTHSTSTHSPSTEPLPSNGSGHTG